MNYVDSVIGSAAKAFEEPRETRSRKRAINELNDGSLICKVGMIASAALITFAVLLTAAAGVTAIVPGSILAGLGVGLFLTAYDFHTVFENALHILDDDEAYGRCLRLKAQDRANELFRNVILLNLFFTQRDKSDVARGLLKV